MRFAVRLAAAAFSTLALFAPALAGAVEGPTLGGQPVLIDVTNTSILNYHFANRNENGTVGTIVDDNYGEWLDRFNLQVSWWRLRLGLRLDSAVFGGTPSPQEVLKIAADQHPGATRDDAKSRNSTASELYNELHSRYLRTFYPSKLFLGYQQPGLDVTVGDFYAQLGHGLVFSVRKIDELAVDTTVRGAKVVADHEFGSFRLAGTLFVGQMNPLRIDENSGRRLHGEGSPLFFGFPHSGDLTTYDYDDATGKPALVLNRSRPSYLEDTVLGTHLEGGNSLFSLGVNTSLLARKSHTEEYLACRNTEGVVAPPKDLADQCANQFPEFASTDPSRSHNTIVTYSGSLTVPSIAKHGDLYVEVAGQALRDGHVGALTDSGAPAERKPNISGYAVYASASVTAGPLSVSLEGKHYRNFFPLSPNIDTTSKGFGAPEYSLITYNQAPTVEPIYTEPVSGGSPQVCVSGGRGRADYRFNRGSSVYAWVGRTTSWSELPGAPLDKGCSLDTSQRTDTWDTAAGVDLAPEQGRSHVRAWVGARLTDTAAVQEQALEGPTTVFYREGYLRYDLLKHLSGPFSLQLQGFHRRRFEALSFKYPWTEGENYTALEWSPHFSVVFGAEYIARESLENACQPERPATLSEPGRAAKSLCLFFNGGVQWRAHSGDEGPLWQRTLGRLFDTVNMFVGQRRGALRCVSGVCRQFPPFEGAKLEITSRF